MVVRRHPQLVPPGVSSLLPATTAGDVLCVGERAASPIVGVTSVEDSRSAKRRTAPQGSRGSSSRGCAAGRLASGRSWSSDRASAGRPLPGRSAVHASSCPSMPNEEVASSRQLDNKTGLRAVGPQRRAVATSSRSAGRQTSAASGTSPHRSSSSPSRSASSSSSSSSLPSAVSPMNLKLPIPSSYSGSRVRK